MTFYGITTRNNRSSNPCRRAELCDYPIPVLLEYEDCERFIAMYYRNEPGLYDTFEPKIESEAKCWTLVKQMVEVNSGRRIVSNGNMIVVNESRPTFEHIVNRHFTTTDWPWKEWSEHRASLYREMIRNHLYPRLLRRPAMKRREKS